MASYPRGLTRRPRHARIAKRPRLVSTDALGKLTIIEGASGLGKSVLAGQIVDALGRQRQGWCRLAPGWSQAPDIVALAADSLGQDVGVVVDDLIGAAGQLLAVFEAAPTSLVIDDLHESEGSEAERLLAEVIAFLPEDAAVVVTTRRRPAELIGLVDPALVQIVGPADLRFDEHETRELLAERGADESLAAELVRTVGGTAAALAAAADAGTVAAGLEQSLDQVFSKPVLGQLNVLAQAAAVLPYLTPALVTELQLAEPDALAQLAEQTSLFTETGGSWQLHATAREHVMRQLPPEQVGHVRRQAATALSNIDPITSIGLFVEAGAAEEAGDLLAANAAEVGAARATRWLYALPTEVRQRMPPILTGGRATVNVSVAIIAAQQQVAAATTEHARAQHLVGLGSLLLADGDLAEAAESFESALRLTTAGTGIDRIGEQLGLTRWYAGDTSGARVALGANNGSPWAYWLRAQLALLDSNHSEAQALGELAVQAADGTDTTAAPGLAATAEAALATGDDAKALATATAAYEQALTVGGRDLAAAGWVYVWCLVRVNDFDAAEAVCDQLQRTIGRHDYATRVNIALARRTMAELTGQPDAERSRRRVADLRSKGFAVLEAVANVLGPTATMHPLSKAVVEVRLLGSFDLTVDGALVTGSAWKSKKAHEVCAYLAYAGPAGARREEVIETVWPDRPPDKGRTLLRTALTEIRKVLEPRRAPGAPSRFVVVDGDRVMLRDATTDLGEAEALLSQGQAVDAFGVLVRGLAPGAPESEWLVQLSSVIGRLTIEAASRVVIAPATTASLTVSAYEALIAEEPWDKKHFDGLIAHYRSAGDEAAAADIERRWFADD